MLTALLECKLLCSPCRHVTMAKLLEQLTKRAKNEVNEALRVLVSSCNGIAAIYQIKHQVFVRVCVCARACMRTCTCPCVCIHLCMYNTKFTHPLHSGKMQ